MRVSFCRPLQQCFSRGANLSVRSIPHSCRSLKGVQEQTIVRHATIPSERNPSSSWQRNSFTRRDGDGDNYYETDPVGVSSRGVEPVPNFDLPLHHFLRTVCFEQELEEQNLSEEIRTRRIAVVDNEVPEYIAEVMKHFCSIEAPAPRYNHDPNTIPKNTIELNYTLTYRMNRSWGGLHDVLALLIPPRDVYSFDAHYFYQENVSLDNPGEVLQRQIRRFVSRVENLPPSDFDYLQFSRNFIRPDSLTLKLFSLLCLKQREFASYLDYILFFNPQKFQEYSSKYFAAIEKGTWTETEFPLALNADRISLYEQLAHNYKELIFDLSAYESLLKTFFLLRDEKRSRSVCSLIEKYHASNISIRTRIDMIGVERLSGNYQLLYERYRREIFAPFANKNESNDSTGEFKTNGASRLTSEHFDQLLWYFANTDQLTFVENIIADMIGIGVAPNPGAIIILTNVRVLARCERNVDFPALLAALDVRSLALTELLCLYKTCILARHVTPGLLKIEDTFIRRRVWTGFFAPLYMSTCLISNHFTKYKLFADHLSHPRYFRFAFIQTLLIKARFRFKQYNQILDAFRLIIDLDCRRNAIVLSNLLYSCADNLDRRLYSMLTRHLEEIPPELMSSSLLLAQVHAMNEFRFHRKGLLHRDSARNKTESLGVKFDAGHSFREVLQLAPFVNLPIASATHKHYFYDPRHDNAKATHSYPTNFVEDILDDVYQLFTVKGRHQYGFDLHEHLAFEKLILSLLRLFSKYNYTSPVADLLEKIKGLPVQEVTYSQICFYLRTLNLPSHIVADYISSATLFRVSCTLGSPPKILVVSSPQSLAPSPAPTLAPSAPSPLTSPFVFTRESALYVSPEYPSRSRYTLYKVIEVIHQEISQYQQMNPRRIDPNASSGKKRYNWYSEPRDPVDVA